MKLVLVGIRGKGFNMKKVNQRCAVLKLDIEEINMNIKSHEEIINTHKSNIKDIEVEKRITRNNMKNKMTKYGVSVDLVANFLTPNIYRKVFQAGFEMAKAPDVEEIVSLMKKIEMFENEVNALEKEIFSIGIEIRRYINHRDDLVRDWRYLKCAKL